ncbi:MAG: antibiotic biosynthesis monooxygenase [Porticoccaceae bacterium]|jgi:antibiotic biosynthesis monooxygenase (ABM) superfamily enzyme|nr:antibiotic biosynthesis monooxygenase [Porticoccaceae bacterium]
MLAVLIKRTLASEMESTYEAFSRKIIQAAVPAKGFISSKSFKDLKDTKIRYTLIQMECLADWKAWYESDERRVALLHIQPLLVEDEHISILTTA